VTRARLGALLLPPLLLPFAWIATPAQGAGGSAPERAALVVDVPRVSFEELMSVAEVNDLSRRGGAGLLANPREIVVVTPPAGPTDDIGPRVERSVILDPDHFGGLDAVGRELRRIIESFPAEQLLVIVYSSRPSSEMIGTNDQLHGIAMAIGAPVDLLPQTGNQGSLTSASTRRDGVVLGGDIRETVDTYLGGLLVSGPLPPGEPIEIIPGPPPFELHERYLAQRRMYVPIGTAGAIYLSIAGFGAIVVLALGSRVPRGVRRIFGWGCLSVAALSTSLLAAGHLPDLSYATVVPFVALVTVFGTLAFAPLEHRDVLLIPAGIGIAVLGFFAAEAILAWTAALTPFVGGSELDGGRFYGLPNVFIGLLIGASLWIAQRLRTLAGFALLVAAALFAGLPYLGANLGGGVSLFAAAGLWVAIHERERLGVWRGIGVFVSVTVLGAAVILAAHAISPFETHVARFEERAGGPAGVFEKIGDRLQVGFDLIARNPFALIPVLGLPIAIAAVLRPPAALRPSLQRSPAWRDAILVTLLAGVVAYLANDSGPAAAGFAFGLGLGGLLGVSLLSEAGKMGEP
jgi:hypothetical protein